MIGWKWVPLFVAAAGVVGATTLKTFDGPIFDNAPLSLTTQLAGDGLNFACSPSCGFTVQNNTQGGLLVPSGRNYVNLSGPSGVQFVVTFSGPVDDISFQTLGLLANGGGYLDGANVSFLDGAGNVLATSLNGGGAQNSWSIAPITSSATTFNVQTYQFVSSTDVHQLVFSKVYGAQGGGYFGFDNLIFGAPEPGSLLLAGAGLLVTGLLRKRWLPRA